MTNILFVAGVMLLATKLHSTNLVVLSFMFEDGSGNNFTGEAFDTKEKKTYNFFFKVENGVMTSFNKWEKRKVQVSYN